MTKRMVFSTPCIYESGEFGCASFGFAGAPNPNDKVKREWNYEIKGEMFTGTLEEILEDVKKESAGKTWQAGIVLFGNCGGENEFIHSLQSIVKCSLTGGAAAIDLESGKSGLVAGGGQVAVYLIDDDQVKVHVESKNIHDHILGKHAIGYSHPRYIDTIDGEEAVNWFKSKRQEYGIDESDFEHMTFSDENGINAHLSMNEGKLFSGRDLTENMVLRYVDKGNVYPQMAEFYDDPKALVFGCAGLKGILEEDIMLDSMGMFLFGEVATLNGISEFGNLMLSKLVIE